MTKVLVAEPSAPISAALRKFLEGSAEVVVAHFLDEAVQQVLSEPPQVLLASVSSTFDGEALCTQVRRQLPSLAVVLVYPPEEEKAAERALAIGADAFLVGPLKRAAVLNAVRTVTAARELKLKLGAVEAELAALKRQPAPRARPMLATGVNTADEAFFKKYLLLEVKRSKRYQYPSALLLVCLDGLERYLAQEASPEFQRAAIRAEVLSAISGLIRDIDLVMPFAGDKYLVLLPHTPRSGCTVAAQRIAARLSTVDHFQGGTASVGVASYDPRVTPKAQVSFGQLVREAAASLKKAQAEGGGRVELAPSAAPVKKSRISMA